jgi:hypothetical protein
MSHRQSLLNLLKPVKWLRGLFLGGLDLDDLTPIIGAAIGAGMMGKLGGVALGTIDQRLGLELHMGAAFALSRVCNFSLG